MATQAARRSIWLIDLSGRWHTVLSLETVSGMKCPKQPTSIITRSTTYPAKFVWIVYTVDRYTLIEQSVGCSNIEYIDLVL